MDWDWFKSFPETLKSQIKSMKITVNWEKAACGDDCLPDGAAFAAHRWRHTLAFEMAETVPCEAGLGSGATA